MAPKSIKYTQLPRSEYSQTTLGQMNGFLIETDQIQLRPLLLERDAPLLWGVYKNYPELFKYMPGGAHYCYENFYKEQENFVTSGAFSNWAVYVSAPVVDKGEKEGEEEDEEKKWVLCGSICLLDIVLRYRRFEIGAIWFHPSVQGTFVMVETAYALLRFSFEKLRAGRVQWKTHHQNLASQKAATKLGFREEGIFRKHMIHADGTWRHTLFYAMTDDEWFGREEGETVDGRAGLLVEAEKDGEEVEEGKKNEKGLQKRLEGVVEGRKKEGKPLTEGIVRGEALV
ncbi:hypothetical protein BGZ95_003743 [Linnemannia exigua]|uniref:N-acetyltransferase domain-containing protein n=1 Tax=Linnemannia exigua TaxID=604196 RepID=A0AAD4H2J3_9FUNG|nr:hypothetical protein BGZ95_003743 [Linnemannia exigua]